MPRLNSGVRAVMLPVGSMIALIPVLATRTIGTLVSTERIAAIASSWYGAELVAVPRVVGDVDQHVGAVA